MSMHEKPLVDALTTRAACVGSCLAFRQVGGWVIVPVIPTMPITLKCCSVLATVVIGAATRHAVGLDVRRRLPGRRHARDLGARSPAASAVHLTGRNWVGLPP